jgi:DNA-binding NtrC family response regulator
MSHVLIVDDAPAICWSVREALSDDGHEATVAASAEEALALAEQGCRPDAVMLDVRLPGMDGLTALRRIQNDTGGKPVIVMTAFGSLDTAVRAVEEGAFDYLVKPFDLDQAMAVVRRALDSPAQTPDTNASESAAELEAMVGTSAAMQQVYRQIALVAASDVNVLITGESGTGKELVARAIHQHSSRKTGPLVPVCLPALSEGVIESELFGHLRGAFTGATENRSGLLEMAAGGTVFLDEIADIPPGLQVKLLRALEQREVFAVGDSRPRAIDIRVLAATNRPLPDLIAAGRFREDLYFRLGVFQIHLPPLRERRADIPLLAGHFLRRFARANGRGGLHFSDDCLQELCSRPWPGNVRELRNAVERSAVLARAGEIQPAHLPPPAPIPSSEPDSVVDEVRQRIASWTLAELQQAADPDALQLYDRLLQLVEPPLLETTLRRCDQNRTAAAQLLSLHRATLRQKLRRYGIGQD